MRSFRAIIHAEGAGFVSLCPELDIASQGETIEEARDNLREALELFFECASAEEIEMSSTGEVYVTQVEVSVGLRVLSGNAACAILRQHEFSQVRRRGMQQASKGTTTTLPVPGHDPLKIGTLPVHHPPVRVAADRVRIVICQGSRVDWEAIS